MRKQYKKSIKIIHFSTIPAFELKNRFKRATILNTSYMYYFYGKRADKVLWLKCTSLNFIIKYYLPSFNWGNV